MIDVADYKETIHSYGDAIGKEVLYSDIGSFLPVSIVTVIKLEIRQGYLYDCN